MTGIAVAIDKKMMDIARRKANTVRGCKKLIFKSL